MASYQARRRDPLLDSNTQAIIERRGKELLGFGLMTVGFLIALTLWSYSADDPSWLSVTDEPVRNFLGRFGASVASPLVVIAGAGAWGIAIAFLAWGVRFLLHIGAERAFGRAIFAPIAIALGAVYMSTHIPGIAWKHSFGLGGLFGDTVLGAVLGVVPISATLGLKVMAFFMAIATLAMAAFALGFTRAELRSIGKFLLVGLIMIYATALTFIVKFSHWVTTAFLGVHSWNSNRREQRKTAAAIAAASVAEQAVVHRAEPTVEPILTREALPKTEPLKGGLFAKMPSLLKRAPAPDMEAEPTLYTAEDFGDPQIKARIAEVIRNRVSSRAGEPDTAIRQEPPVSSRHPRGPQPMIVQSAVPNLENGLEDAASGIGGVIDDYGLDGTPEPAAFEASAPPQHDAKRVVQHAARKAVRPSQQAKAEAQPTLQFEENTAEFETPPLNLLSEAVESERHHLSDEELEENARMLESVLDDYGVKGEIVSVRPGPVVTMYELEPAPGLKAGRVIGLSDDIARSMSALSARVSTVPGRSIIGIELPNVRREKVVLREILAARDFGDSNMRLPLALGKDIGGDPIVVNLAKMPHLLIAGTTGSGKSVAINTMILSLLYKLTPNECRLIMIDPKMLELSVYDGIPHLLSPVVTDPKKAVVALKWVVGEMEERYRKMSKLGVRNIDGYNGRVRDALSRDEMFKRTVQTGFDEDSGEPIFETDEFKPETLPYIVVVVDEMADLMMVAGKEIEACIQRLAQMARASGIHLIMATQRPSVDVITGTIKANFPTRISFQVTSKIDSRTILGDQGAEQLLGMGDMLFMAGGAKITRIHGPFVSDEEVEDIVNHLKAYGPPEYVGGVQEAPPEGADSNIDLVLGLGGNTNGEDALYDQAVAIVTRDRKCSTSYIQRKLAIGYNKAARLVEQMEDQGLVSQANHVGKREILIPEPQ
ncbi:MAG: DNA translocase FtsK 4TM domain-containing protein [Marinosulfonomonas sp.]|nr:DNA translocase FtsK 4TM domain-containing protein [Marinosulfonomonas sp.]